MSRCLCEQKRAETNCKLALCERVCGCAFVSGRARDCVVVARFIDTTGNSAMHLTSNIHAHYVYLVCGEMLYHRYTSLTSVLLQRMKQQSSSSRTCIGTSFIVLSSQRGMLRSRHLAPLQTEYNGVCRSQCLNLQMKFQTTALCTSEYVSESHQPSNAFYYLFRWFCASRLLMHNKCWYGISTHIRDAALISYSTIVCAPEQQETVNQHTNM